MKLFIDIVTKQIYLFNIVAWNYRKKIGFPVCKKKNFAGLQGHRKRGKSARASPTPHHTLEMSSIHTGEHTKQRFKFKRRKIVNGKDCVTFHRTTPYHCCHSSFRSYEEFSLRHEWFLISVSLKVRPRTGDNWGRFVKTPVVQFQALAGA